MLREIVHFNGNYVNSCKSHKLQINIISETPREEEVGSQLGGGDLFLN